MITGGIMKKPKVDQYADPSEMVDLRTVDSRNCFDDTVPKKRYRSSSPESMSAQLKLDCGFDERHDSKFPVRLSQSGIFYYRREIETSKPEIWWSWMKPPTEKPMSPISFLPENISFGPSSPPPHNPPSARVVEKFKPSDERSTSRKIQFQSSLLTRPPSMPYPFDLSNNPRPNSPPSNPPIFLSNDVLLRRYVND